MTAKPRFVHLRCHTEYSLLEGALRVAHLPQLCRAVEMPAVAVTDTNNMFAALEFSETASKAGIQPIVGAQIDVVYEEAAPGAAAAAAPMVLLAQNETGYRNLLALNTCLYLDPAKPAPQATLAELAAHAGGLIALTGGPDGPLGRLLQAGRRAWAEALAGRLADIYPGRLYVELQRHPGEDGLPEAERLTERGLVEIAYAGELPLVATNDVHFAAPAMHAAHDALLAIADGAYVDQAAPRRQLTAQHYFKTPDEMAALFADLPEALASTVEIARRCAVRAETAEPMLPRFAENEVAELRRQARAGLETRLATIPPAAPRADYDARLDYELGVIERMGFPGYFLIVADFIQWAKARDIPVGPGRGSGAGSLVAYALTITDLDPLRYALLFERFLNPERVSMPDFDIDFCMDRREEVIEYVQQRYGADRVAQIITFGALLSKAAVRDVGRVLQMPYGQVDRLSKMIPVEGAKPVSIARARAEEPRLAAEAERDETVARLLDHGEQLEGLLRNASTHAAGVVIGDRPLDRMVPLFKDPRSELPATQFSMKWAEAAGLVKFDFLGLKTLTVIQEALDMLRARGVGMTASAIPLDDAATFDLYASARTVGVFQVESAGMMDALRRMRPTAIEDIVALVALYRPGPMENIPKYCEVKNGLSAREHIHPLIDHLLDETQGIIVYQEQVMQIAQEMADYSLGGADLLRRAMGKKIQSAMDAERPRFIEGATANGVSEEKAVEVWNLLDKFANYGFNKSHAAAYAVVSYQTAWLKANHPAEFMAAVMNADITLTDKLATYAEEVRRNLAIEIVAPCVNRGRARFSVADGRLVYGLGALRNVGLGAMRLIEEARGDRPFVTLFDLARRVDLRQIGKRTLEVLARAGAFDVLDSNRRRVAESLDALIAYSAAVADATGSAQVSLFGEAGEDLPEPRLAACEDWPAHERLAAEQGAVGFYLSGHPLDDYAGALRRKGVQTIAELRAAAQAGPRVARLAGAVAGLQERKSSKGNRYAFVQLSDASGHYEVTVFADVLEPARRHLEAGANVVLGVEATAESEQLKLLARTVQPIDEAVGDAAAQGLRVFVGDEPAVEAVAALLQRNAEEGGQRGRGPVHFCLSHPELPGEVEVALDRSFPVTPRVQGAIKSLPGVLTVEEF